MSEMNDRPRPHPDRDSAPYWAALSTGELRLQECCDCEVLRWPPRAICNRCHSFSAKWQPVSGRGTIISWTRTHQVFAAAYQSEVPYIVVQVRLAEQEDILMIGGWLSNREPIAGEEVRLRIVDADTDTDTDTDVALPYWETI